MNKLFRILIFSICCVSFVCCERTDISRKLKLFTSKPVVLPDYIEAVRGNESWIEPFTVRKPTLVIYVDSTDCSSCHIGHLNRYIILFNSSEIQEKINVKIIYHPKHTEYERIKREIQFSLLDFPVYIVNEDDCIDDKNGIIDKDKRFHSFLIDTQRVPMLVGDPTTSDNMWSLFEKVIKGL